MSFFINCTSKLLQSQMKEILDRNKDKHIQINQTNRCKQSSSNTQMGTRKEPPAIYAQTDS